MMSKAWGTFILVLVFGFPIGVATISAYSYPNEEHFWGMIFAMWVITQAVCLLLLGFAALLEDR
jgi:hypothetical protein